MALLLEIQHGPMRAKKKNCRSLPGRAVIFTIYMGIPILYREFTALMFVFFLKTLITRILEAN